MVNCCEHRVWESKTSNKLRILIPLSRRWGVNFIIVVGIFDMEFARINAHNRTYRYNLKVLCSCISFTKLHTVLLVHLLYFPNVHPTTKDVVIELISMCYSRQLGTWKSAERMEVKTIEASQDKVETTKAK